MERVAESIQGIALRGCSSRVCPYVIIDLINGREAHNTLCREAKVGRLVEKMARGKRLTLWGSLTPNEFGMGMLEDHLAVNTPIIADSEEETILAALESLAAGLGER